VALSPGLKRLGHEASHSPSATAEVKKMWSYTSTALMRLHGVVLNNVSTGTTFLCLTLAVIVLM
jgi:hypothetical protein